MVSEETKAYWDLEFYYLKDTFWKGCGSLAFEAKEICRSYGGGGASDDNDMLAKVGKKGPIQQMTEVMNRVKISWKMDQEDILISKEELETCKV